MHPQKAEIKFEDESLLFKTIYHAVLEAVKPSDNQALSDFAIPVTDKALHIEKQCLNKSIWIYLKTIHLLHQIHLNKIQSTIYHH